MRTYLRDSWSSQYADYLGWERASSLVDRLFASNELKQLDEPSLIVATLGHKPIGIAASRLTKGLSMITMLEVMEPYRNLGVARQMLRALEVREQRQLAYVSIHRPAVRTFYERSGFQALNRTVVNHYGHALEFDVFIKLHQTISTV
ncbi:MAG: GNAT family N-acetyltransferase [Granulosicoccus sp.]|nr:GNAT family N-acetyltransferase [Granulosicoccus sp.]